MSTPQFIQYILDITLYKGYIRYIPTNRDTQMTLNQVGNQFQSVLFTTENNKLIAKTKYSEKSNYFIVTFPDRKFLKNTCSSFKNAVEYINSVA